MTSQPKIFFRDSRKDRDAAVRICETLQKAGLQVWFDDSSLSPGQNWIAQIDKALANAGYLLALLSTNSIQSEWVKQKWTTMLSRQVSGRTAAVAQRERLLPVRRLTHPTSPRF